MKQEFCVGICPHCEGNGLLLLVKDNNTNEISICCDECYQEFKTMDDVKQKNSFISPNLNNLSIELEEALERGWADYIFVLENGKWLKYTDKTKKLF